MKHVFIIGSKGIPAKYGGFETFVDNLVCRAQDSHIKYHVACMSDADQAPCEYHGAECFFIKCPNIGPAKAIYYDWAAFRWCLKRIREEQITEPIVYVLACRIGPLVGALKRKLRRLGGTLFVNPDGHEFLRAKWSAPVRKYWKFSEKLMVKHADLLVCDSKCIQDYIQADYRQYQPKTLFIPYGTEIYQQRPMGDKLMAWYKQFDLQPEEYYLIVGRFVPENNYQIVIQEFLKSHTDKKLVLITNVEQNQFLDQLRQTTHFDQDSRILFPGTVYDQELLAQIRAYAYGYFHGHEVGGTNPSLLEAMGTTKLNLLLDVGFNREVGQTGALYWTKEAGNLAGLIAQVERLSPEERERMGRLSKQRMIENYSWEQIVNQYEDLFLGKTM